MGTLQQMDGELLISIQSVFIHDWLTPAMKFITSLGNSGIIWIALTLVMKAIRELEPDDFAAYAPIAGLPAYLDAVKKAVFMDEPPRESFVEACYAPGGTGAIRNAISAYTKPGDRILTSDWHWSPYEVVAAEIGRSVSCYSLFDDEMKFNGRAFAEKLDEILKEQNETLVIINTPAHNPTGYTLTDSDWDSVLTSIKAHPGKKIALLADIAYIDFAGDAKKYRGFLKKLEGLPQNIMPLIAFSASKGYTMYGMAQNRKRRKTLCSQSGKWLLRSCSGN